MFQFRREARRMLYRVIHVCVLVALAGAVSGCSDDDDCCFLDENATFFQITRPVERQVSLAGPVDVRLTMPAGADRQSFAATLDGGSVTDAFAVSAADARATLTNVAAGEHRLVAQVRVGEEMRRAEVSFETVALTNPDECEVLNNAECLLPYPSARFLEAADTPTGWQLRFPASGMPRQAGEPLPATPYEALDGFSPTVQILMHFPGGVDPVRSNAARLLAETRTFDARSLDADSPTVLFDADTGERILHFIEVDVRAPSVDRQVLFLRPGKSLTPGHRYIVAVRNLAHADGTPVAAEPVFAALRDDRVIDIAAVEARREHFENLFAELDAHGVPRDDLVLAFDFVVQSDRGLTGQMLSMRDQAFDWLATTDAVQTFTVDRVLQQDCSADDVFIWRQVEGTYEVPLFLESDPETDARTPARLNVDADDNPVHNGFTTPPFTIAIPCSVLGEDLSPTRPLVLGHGLFGSGRSFVSDVAQSSDLNQFDYLIGATNWRGLSAPDIAGGDLIDSFIGQVVLRLRNLPALPDRLRQGQLNTLVLAKMMKTAAFNVDPAFQTPAGVGVFPGPEEEQFYFGASLGGVMGLMFAALSPDVVNVHVDVPAINFSILLQRATPFLPFEGALELTGVTDPLQQALLISVVHELWVRGESAGYATHITQDPLPGTNEKNVLMTAAYLDQQVSNQATEVAARTLQLPSLVGSLQSNLVEIPDVEGPLPSALVMYDTGSFDLDNPAHLPLIPPLANLQPEPNGCDPHGLQGLIPAAIDQLLEFLQPGGQVVNFCNALCDAAEPLELPFGDETPCDPLAD